MKSWRFAGTISKATALRSRRSLGQTKRHGLVFKSTKEENIPGDRPAPSAVAALEPHRKCRDEFRTQFGSDYRTDLDLIFANPDGTPLNPDSISATVSASFKRLKIQEPRGATLHLLRRSHGSYLLSQRRAATGSFAAARSFLRADNRGLLGLCDAWTA